MGLSEYAASLVVGTSRRWSLRWLKVYVRFKFVHEAAKANPRIRIVMIVMIRIRTLMTQGAAGQGLFTTRPLKAPDGSPQSPACDNL